MELNYIANNTFAQVHQDPNPYVFIRGPVGSGKSSGCIMHCFLNAMNQAPDSEGKRRTRFAVLRSTYPALKTTVVKSWIDWFKGLLKVTYDIPIRGYLEVPHPDGMTLICMEIMFIALDREDQANKLQSLELTGAHMNEAAEIPRFVFQMLKTRINRFPSPRDEGVTQHFILADYNSPDTEHWLYYLAEEERPKKHSFYRQPPAMIWDGEDYQTNKEADNVENLPPDYYPDIVAGNDPDYVNVFVLNNYGMLRTGKPVYVHYKDSIHCSDTEFQPISGVPMIIGMDMGLTPAAAFLQLSPSGTLLIFDEIVTEDCSIRKFCDDYLWPKIRNEYHGINFHLIIDPAATQRSQNDARSAAEIIRDAGLPYRTAKTNADLARREAINFFLLKQDGLKLSPKCTYLRKGFISEYKFGKIRAAESDRFKEKPEKNIFSHVHDAAQYAALECSGGRIGKRRHKRKTNSASSRPADMLAGY